MPGDMVVARGRCTVDRSTLFAHNSDQPAGECPVLQIVAGRSFAAGETVPTQFLRLPQVRQTFTVLAAQPLGHWGYDHGVNEHGVAIGRTSQRSKITCAGPALTGTDLVRLALERTRSAHQAVDLVTDCIERHGQGRFPGYPSGAAADSAFLVADADTAFVIEAAGNHWVLKEIDTVRAVGNVSLVQQDWDRIARGLAGRAIEQGWWPADGSKLDFASALSEDLVGPCSALRRWGRAMRMLEQQAGHLDVAFLRRLLSDHYETMRCEVDPFMPGDGPTPLCQHGGAANSHTAASLVVALKADNTRLTPVWCALGPPCISVYFPLFLEGDLPAALTGAPMAESVWWRVHRLNEQLQRNPQRVSLLGESLGRLQARLDQEAEEFAQEAALFKQQGSLDELKRQATFFMQHALEQFVAVLDSLMSAEPRPPIAVARP